MLLLILRYWFVTHQRYIWLHSEWHHFCMSSNTFCSLFWLLLFSYCRTE